MFVERKEIKFAPGIKARLRQSLFSKLLFYSSEIENDRIPEMPTSTDYP